MFLIPNALKNRVMINLAKKFVLFHLSIHISLVNNHTDLLTFAEIGWPPNFFILGRPKYFVDFINLKITFDVGLILNLH